MAATGENPPELSEDVKKRRDLVLRNLQVKIRFLGFLKINNLDK